MNYTLLGIIALIIAIVTPLTYISLTTWNWLNTHMQHGICSMHELESMHEYCEEEHEEDKNYEGKMMVIEATIIGKIKNTIYVKSSNRVLSLELRGLWNIIKDNDPMHTINSSTLMSKYLEVNKTIILVIDKIDGYYELREIIIPNRDLVISKIDPYDRKIQIEEHCPMS